MCVKCRIYEFVFIRVFLTANMNEKICRFCLQTISSNNCRAVEESLLKFLKLNINISKENVTCIECADRLRVFSNLTSGCVYTGDGALPLSDLENGVMLDPETMETTSSSKSLVETKIKCSFCIKTLGREDLISLMESKENKFLVNTLQQYISETNIKNSEELLTCETCLEALQGGLNVILKCLEVEKKISKYIELEGTDDKGQIELKEVQQFTFEPILKVKIESLGVNELEAGCDQKQTEYTTMAESEIEYEKEIRNMKLSVKTEDDDIKSEDSDYDVTNIKIEQSDCDGFQESFIEDKTASDPLHISAVRSKTGKSKDRIEQHLLTHKSPAKIKTFKCELCSYEAKQKCRLKRHLSVHERPSETMFKCELCPYKSKQRWRCKQHLLTHNSLWEVKVFKCEFCPYIGKEKSNFKQHLLTHKSPSELKMLKCKLCPYEAKRKSHLNEHLLVHKDPSEIKMLKCELCPYEAKRRSHLNVHLLVHKSPSEIRMFKCELCPYEAKRNHELTGHLKIHKSSSEIKMFKCELCSYESKQKRSLKTHLLIHKDPSEIKTLKCD